MNEVTATVTLTATPLGFEVDADPAEIMIAWGDDTRCSSCLCDLPAGATGYVTGGGVICVDCREREIED
jgi:hypothetical protein